MDKKFDAIQTALNNLNSKFDRLDERQISTAQRIDKLENQVNTELKEQRAEGNKLFNRVLDVFKDVPKVAVT
jgi:DNA-binding protein H-NS